MDHTWLSFVFLIQMGFHHVGQACLIGQASSEPLASASPSADITGVSHCTKKEINDNFFPSFLPSSFPPSLLSFFQDEVLLYHLGWSTVAQSWLTTISISWVQAILPPQPPR